MIAKFPVSTVSDFISFMSWTCCSSSLSIFSTMQSQNIKSFQKHASLFFKEPKTHFQKPLHSLLKPQQITYSFQMGKLPSVSHFLPTQLTPKSLKTHLHNNILKVTVHKVAILLVGGLFLMGSYGCKPVLAQGDKPSVVETMEEDKVTQSEDSDDEMYLKILEKNPRDVETLKVVLSRKMMKGKRKEAVEYVERLIEIEPNEVEWRLLQALSYEMLGNLNKAKRLFKDILEERPLLLRALHGLAMAMHKNREGPAVFEMLNKALEFAQREKRVTEERNIRILVAQMHVAKGDLEQGLKKFQDLVDENPRDFRPYLCQGIIYSLLNKKTEAEEQFGMYRSLVPQEFPQRGFLDDVVLAAKTEPSDQLQKEFKAEYSYRK
ncbi:hypothetical protein IFM89_039318 [Coptis chinensis]|uniref:Chloroplast lumen common family protein n=1 Tax=Coptis chinensis TaxID=261450 RepID=A0A835HSR1_9MAGN|nr:hypothetical protein IFM89_039318 [Coptis chinensis]